MKPHVAVPRAQNAKVVVHLLSKVLQTPTPWLHIVDEPFINVLVNPVCDKSECEMRTRQQIQDVMAGVAAEVQGEKELDRRVCASLAR
jgi:hypothetical protein